MYDELVKRLKYKAGWDESEDLKEAANAIEELVSILEEARHNYDLANEDIERLEAQIPHWIPVSERFPEEWWPVLGLIKFHDKDEPPAQQVMWYLGNGHWREVWRGDMIENDVTHWMPLPEPPEEAGA